MIRETVNQATDIPRRVERAGDAIDDVPGSEGEGVIDMIWTMMNACKDGVG